MVLASQGRHGIEGIVMERERQPTELDVMVWYCENCAQPLYESSFHCTDLGKQLAPIINHVNSTPSLLTCKHCGHVAEKMSHPPAGAKSASATPIIEPGSHPPPQSLWGWVEANRDSFKPPVGNKMMCGLGCQFKIMLVGGPNTRTDYHVEEMEVVDGGQPKDIWIREGESFLLPAKIPHSPQRFPDTIGLVIEHERLPEQQDYLRWYCQNCKKIVYEAGFHCVDLGTQLAPVIRAYQQSEEMRTCPHCGTVDEFPQKK